MFYAVANMQTKPANYKTKLCEYYSSPGGCNNGQCTYAHGIGELRPMPKNENYKTMPCKNYVSFGECKYKEKCWFLHPEDKEFGLAEKQKAFKEIVQNLFKRKFEGGNYQEIEDKIMRMVKKWNAKHPKGPYYYDFHGLTVAQAEQYLEEIISELRKKKVKVFKIETGRGNHSEHEESEIRKKILAKYQGSSDLSCVLEPGNDGIIIVTFIEAIPQV